MIKHGTITHHHAVGRDHRQVMSGNTALYRQMQAARKTTVDPPRHPQPGRADRSTGSWSASPAHWAEPDQAQASPRNQGRLMLHPLSRSWDGRLEVPDSAQTVLLGPKTFEIYLRAGVVAVHGLHATWTAIVSSVKPRP